MSNTSRFFIPLVLFLAVVVLALPLEALAAVGEGGKLPYEGWLTSLRASVTGPVAFTFAIIGIVTAGCGLIFGQDLNAFFRSLLLLVLIMAFLVGAQNILSGFFGQSAVIASLPLCLQG